MRASPTERLFLALTLPSPLREALAQLTQPLPGVTWTRPELLHVTLRFLGDVPSDQIEHVMARLATVDVASFILPVEGLGTFPPNHAPRIAWAGIGSGHPRLFQLRQRVDDAVLATGLPIDVRTFHPHVTLARCTEKAEAPMVQWLRAHREFVAPPFRAESFDLYASELRPTGAIHTLKRRFPLAR